SLLEMELPAAATNSISLALARLISSSRAWDNAPPPQLYESTRTLEPPVAAKAASACTAESMASVELAAVTEPKARRHLLALAPVEIAQAAVALMSAPGTPTEA